MSNQDVGECTVRLVERRRRIATNEETHANECTVHCPLSQSARAVRWCQGCAHFQGEVSAAGLDFVECRVPPGAAVPQALCGELLSPEVTCLDSELDASRAVELLEIAGVTSAPVLDDNSVLIGVVSTTALARIRLESAELHGFDSGTAPLEVEDAMSTEVATLSEQATLGEAARLMARRNLDRVPIVTDDGHLVGVISAMDVVRWLSSRIP